MRITHLATLEKNIEYIYSRLKGREVSIKKKKRPFSTRQPSRSLLGVTVKVHENNETESPSYVKFCQESILKLFLVMDT